MKNPGYALGCDVECANLMFNKTTTSVPLLPAHNTANTDQAFIHLAATRR